MRKGKIVFWATIIGVLLMFGSSSAIAATEHLGEVQPIVVQDPGEEQPSRLITWASATLSASYTSRNVGQYNNFTGSVDYYTANPVGSTWDFYFFIPRTMYSQVTAVAGNMSLHDFAYGTNIKTGETAWAYDKMGYFYVNTNKWINASARANTPDYKRTTVGTFSDDTKLQGEWANLYTTVN